MTMQSIPVPVRICPLAGFVLIAAAVSVAVVLPALLLVLILPTLFLLPATSAGASVAAATTALYRPPAWYGSPRGPPRS